MQRGKRTREERDPRNDLGVSPESQRSTLRSILSSCLSLLPRTFKQTNCPTPRALKASPSYRQIWTHTHVCTKGPLAKPKALDGGPGRYTYICMHVHVWRWTYVRLSGGLPNLHWKKTCHFGSMSAHDRLKNSHVLWLKVCWYLGSGRRLKLLKHLLI